MAFEIRPITPDEFSAFSHILELAFGNTWPEKETESFRSIFEFDRSLAVFDQGEIVATAGAFSFELTVPGPAFVPAAGVTVVSVLATHRRRGLLRSMMQRQLADIRERGEPLAMLLASESVIYGRFGYGLATTQVHFEIDKRHGAFARPIDTPGRLTLLAPEAARSLLPEVYEGVRRIQPGTLSRSPAWWDHYFRDFESWRDGMSGRYYVAYLAASGEAQGYVSYRMKSNWAEGLPGYTLAIGELMALTVEARAALWQYCFNVDLVATVKAVDRPIDDPLRWMLADPRRLRVPRLGDFLWVRLVDLPAALMARRYSATDCLVFEVEDPFCLENSGRYQLAGGSDGAECRRSSAEPDISLQVADLGATFLGGVRFDTLARAGRVHEQTPGAIRRADAMFASDPAPWCTTEF